MMLLQKGTHGTCRSRAQIISQNGFEIFNTSPRRGLGVYFWRDNFYAVEFAKGWHKQELRKGAYRYESVKTCSVIKADLKVEDDQIFNVDDPLVKDKLFDFIGGKNITKDKDICKVYDNFVKCMELKLNKKIKIVLTQVRVPESDFPRYFIETAYCYVVRSIDCIHITAIDNYDERYVKC